jgi:hypothetical protein
MMRKTLEVIRIVGVSFEALWLVVIVALFTWKDLWLVFIGRNLLEHDDVTEWLPALPMALCGTAVFLALKLTEPKSKNNKVLHEWPDYWRLAYRRNVGIIWCCTAAFIAVVPWIFRDELHYEWVGGLFLLAVGLSVISSGSLLFATFVLKHIMTMADSE